MGHKTLFKTSLFVLVALILAFPSTSFSAGVSSTGGQFLKIPAGVRSAALGETFTAIADDVSTTHWNTAGLSQLELYEVHFHHVSFFESVNYEFLGLGVPVRPGGVVGASAALNLIPSFNSTNNLLAPAGEASDLALSLGFGQSFGRNAAFGLGGKYLSSKLMDASATGFGIDAGVLLYTADRAFTFGLSVQNVGQVSSYDAHNAKEKLPAVYRAGGAWRWKPGQPTRLTVGAEAEKPLDGDPIYHTGAEFWLGVKDVAVAFRGGYKVDKLDDALGDLVGASFGTGVKFSSVQFDYALVPFGILGNTHRVSMTYRFGGSGGRSTEVREKPVAVAIKPQISDYKTGSIKTATFDLKPEARTEIKNWVMEITDPRGNVIKRFTGKGVPPKQITWDGKDDSGNIVTGGIFSSYSLKTVDRKGQQVIASEPIFKLGGAGEARTTAFQAIDPTLLAAAGVQMAGAPQPSLLPETMQPLGPSGVIKAPSMFFRARSSRLGPGFEDYLDQIVKLIRKYPNSRVYIEGHAYREGTENVNLQLSQERADVVLRYLVEKGKVEPTNLYSRGHGSSAPLDMGNTEEARRRNRRVDIVILTK
jgi:outer membrane protein OmpA-like peptidoglycan-associated protein